MKRRARAQRTSRTAGGATAALALALAAAVIATGCGGGGGKGARTTVASHETKTGAQAPTTTRTSTTQAPKKAAAKPPAQRRGSSTRSRHDTNDESGSTPAATVADRFRKFRGCLQQHGVTPGSTLKPGVTAQQGAFEKRLEKLRSAIADCRDELPKSPVPNGFGLGRQNPPRQPTPQERHRAQKARQEARQRLQQVESLRSCLRQHGIGTSSGSAPSPDQVRKAFADCESQFSG